MADDDQAPVQVVMDGKEQEVFLKDIHPLAHTVIIDSANPCMRQPADGLSKNQKSINSQSHAEVNSQHAA